MNRQEIMDRINISDIPDLPPVIKEVFALLKNHSTLEVPVLIAKIASYGELETLILNKFNTEYFRKKYQIHTLEEGIKYFGLRTIQNIILYLVIRSFSVKIQDKTSFHHRSNYWKHCLGTAIIAHHLAVKTKICDPYLMFSYGLIHDIGIFVIEYALPELLAEIRDIQNRGVTHVIAERKVMDGLTHEDIGQWLCEKWELPREIVNLVTFHHRPQSASINTDEIVLFNKADLLSAFYYQSLMGIPPAIDQERILNSLGLDRELITAIIDNLPEEIKKARELFKF